MKYRIKKYTFEDDPDEELTFFTTEYRILWLWMKIDHKNIGRFTWFFSDHTVKLNTIVDAYTRIEEHKRNMLRGKYWFKKSKKIVKKL